MQRLQSLFNRLVGIHDSEAMLRARARSIFNRQNLYSPAMEQPAYLRRRAKIGSVSR